MTEKEYQQQIVDLCKLLHLRYYHTHDSRRSTAGFPDLVIVGENQTIFVEIKTQTGKVRKEQREWLTALAHSGQKAYLWRPSDFNAVTRTLVAMAGKRMVGDQTKTSDV